MQHIEMNGNEVTLAQDCERVGDLLTLLPQHIPQGHIITYLYLDDRQVLGQREELLAPTELATVSKVRVQTMPLSSQVLANIEGLQGFFKDIRPVLRQASRELRYGAISEAAGKLVECFEGIETAVKSIGQIANVLPDLNAGFTPQDMKYFSKREGEFIGTLVNDFQSKDWMSLADRLEFQLDPLLGRWHSTLNRTFDTLNAQNVPGTR